MELPRNARIVTQGFVLMRNRAVRRAIAVTFGAAVAANASFTPGKPDRVSCSAGSCPVTRAPYTAVLVTVG